MSDVVWCKEDFDYPIAMSILTWIEGGGYLPTKAFIWTWSDNKIWIKSHSGDENLKSSLLSLKPGVSIALIWRTIKTFNASIAFASLKIEMNKGL